MTHIVRFGYAIEQKCGCSIDMDHDWDWPGSPHSDIPPIAVINRWVDEQADLD